MRLDAIAFLSRFPAQRWICLQKRAKASSCHCTVNLILKLNDFSRPRHCRSQPSEVDSPDVAARLLVGTPSRDLFSPDVMLLLLRRIPKPHRLECARRVMTALVRKAERTQQEAMRTRCFYLIGAVLMVYPAQPEVLPSRTITPYQYADVAALWGSSTPCETRVVQRSGMPAAFEYVVFREWHMHTYCDIPGDRPDVDWRATSSALVKLFAVRMVGIAMAASGRDLFPAELKTRIARFVVEP